MKPGFREPPVAMDGLRRHVERRRRFRDGQSAEEAQFDDAALPVVESLERLQRQIESDEIRSALDRDRHRVIERRPDGAAAPFGVRLRPGDVDEDAPHEPRRHRKEMRPILPVDACDTSEPKVGLIEQGRRLQAVSGPFSGHAGSRDPVQLAVDERHELIEGGGVASRPRPEQRRDIWSSHGSDRILLLAANIGGQALPPPSYRRESTPESVIDTEGS